MARERDAPRSPEANTERFDSSEIETLKDTHHNPLFLFVVNNVAAVSVFILHLISLEGVLGLVLSVVLTVLVYNTTKDSEATGSFDGSIMNWTLLSFAVITPMSAAVRMSFARREHALHLLATIRGTLLEIFLAHSVWDWGGQESGRLKSGIDWSAHIDETQQVIVGICQELTWLLTLPDTSRAWYKILPPGRKEARRVDQIRRTFRNTIVLGFGRLSMLCETLKREGLPPNEVSQHLLGFTPVLYYCMLFG